MRVLRGLLAPFSLLSFLLPLLLQPRRQLELLRHQLLVQPQL
jgi:hypothetical protein